MDPFGFGHPPAAEQFRKELRTWLADQLTDDIVSAARRCGHSDEAFAIMRRWNATLADARWAAVSWPTAYGGRGASVAEALIHAEEMTWARVPHPLNVIGINNIAPALMEYGTEQQKTYLLPRMLRADDIWCQGMSEPDAGSDLASLRTRAVRDGDEFVVNGQKIWTSLGHRANWWQLYVRTDPDAPKHQGISCLIVDMALPGIEARPLTTLSGDTDFAEVFFTDVRVPASALLGTLNQGWQVATTTLSHERAGAARLYAELQTRLIDLVNDLDEAGDQMRDPAVLRRLGEFELRISYLETLCQRAVSATVHGTDGFATASLAKSVWAEIGQDLAAFGYGMLGDDGGGGQWADYRLTSHALSIAGGTTQINNNITARLLGLPRR